MELNAIVSIRPQFVAKIRSGEKRVEYRRQPFAKKVKKCYIYETFPTCKIVGEFVPIKWICGPKREVWNATKEQSGIDEGFFYDYYDGCFLSFALKFDKVVFYDEPIKLPECFRPPQSFIYTDFELEL